MPQAALFGAMRASLEGVILRPFGPFSFKTCVRVSFHALPPFLSPLSPPNPRTDPRGGHGLLPATSGCHRHGPQNVSEITLRVGPSSYFLSLLWGIFFFVSYRGGSRRLSTSPLYDTTLRYNKRKHASLLLHSPNHIASHIRHRPSTHPPFPPSPPLPPQQQKARIPGSRETRFRNRA